MRKPTRTMALLATSISFVIAAVAPPAAHATVYGGVNFPQGAVSFADTVTLYSPVVKNGEPTAPYRTATEALGTPNSNIVSLGDGGSITVRFLDNVLTGSGTTAKDLWIYEVGPDVEATFVEVSADGVTFVSVGKVGGSTAGVDLDAFGFGASARFYFVRLTDDTLLGDQTGITVGADIDAIGAIATQVVAADTDLDDLSDADESTHGTDPLDRDTDDDGATDGEEVARGTDPLAAPAAAPVANNDAAAGREDTPVDIDVLANDTDADTANADLLVDALSGVSGGTATVLSDGRTVRFTPDADANGPSGFGFDYTATDGALVSGVGRVTVTVEAVEDLAFRGFFRPIDNLPQVNRVKAGQSVPIKFSLGGDYGLDIFASGSPGSAQMTCGSDESVAGDTPAQTAGSSSLTYDASTDTYTFVWKTAKEWTGCRQLVVTLRDGSSHRANFTFVR